MIAASSGKTKRRALSPLCCILTLLDPWKKSCGKPRQHIKKQIHQFADKGPYNQSYDFPHSHVWMWELDHKEGWVLKSWCFWSVVLEKTLESPLKCREIKLSVLNLEYSLEGLMLKLKFQYFVYLMRRANSLEKTLMLAKTEDRRKTGWQRIIPTQQTWIWANSRRLWRTGKPCVLQSHNSQKLDMTWQLNNNNNTVGKFTEINRKLVFFTYQNQ